MIVTSIAGGFFQDHPDAMRALMKSHAYVIAITQLDEFAYSDKVDMILHVGNNHHSLIGKFSITYIFSIDFVSFKVWNKKVKLCIFNKCETDPRQKLYRVFFLILLLDQISSFFNFIENS